MEHFLQSFPPSGAQERELSRETPTAQLQSSESTLISIIWTRHGDYPGDTAEPGPQTCRVGVDGGVCPPISLRNHFFLPMLMLLKKN